MQFVVVALVVAVLLADRLGQPAEMHRRFYQVGVAITLSLLVTGLAVLLFNISSQGTNSPLPVQNEARENILQVFRNRQTFSVGVGLILLVLGALSVSRLQTLYLPLIVAGLITLLNQTVELGTNQVIPFLYASSGEAGATANSLYVGVLATGAIFLLIYGYQHWERSQAPETG